MVLCLCLGLRDGAQSKQFLAQIGHLGPSCRCVEWKPTHWSGATVEANVGEETFLSIERDPVWDFNVADRPARACGTKRLNHRLLGTDVLPHRIGGDLGPTFCLARAAVPVRRARRCCSRRSFSRASGSSKFSVARVAGALGRPWREISSGTRSDAIRSSCRNRSRLRSVACILLMSS